jgi:hypothetical protein
LTDLDDELDLEKLYAEFDGMELFISEDFEHLHNGMFNLWDVDSICVWNLALVRPLE